jgi:effector-binding domain-containing protein
MIVIAEPKLVPRNEQHYVGIRKQVSMAELGTVLPPLHAEVFAWLARKAVEPAGAPFWRYLIIDMDGKLEVDVGAPVADGVQGERQIISDTLPAGTYAMTLHTGHPDELAEATAKLLAWAEEKGIRWKMDGDRWGGRVEWYYSDPETEPDMTKWETELAFPVDEY